MHKTYTDLRYLYEFVRMCVSMYDYLGMQDHEKYFTYLHVCMYIFTHTQYMQ
jgi:hypothetical protein